MKGGKGISANDFLNKPGLILAVAGILTIIGAFGSWGSAGVAVGSTSGWDASAGKMTVVAGLIMLYSSAVRLGYIKFFKRAVPILSVSLITGILVLVQALAAWDQPGGGGWGLYLTVIASLIALFVAFRSFGGKGAISRGRGL